MPRVYKSVLEKQVREHDLRMSKAAKELLTSSDLTQEQAEDYVEKSVDIVKVLGNQTIQDGHVQLLMDIDKACGDMEDSGKKITQKAIKDKAHDLGFNVSKASLPLIADLEKNRGEAVVEFTGQLVTMKRGKTLQDKYVSVIIDLMDRCNV